VAGDCVPGTPVFCDDGDACNGAEVCDDTLGCVAGAVPAPYTEVAVRCALDLLWSTFRADSPSEFGGRKHYTGLQRILIRVRKNFLYYSPRDNGKPQRSIMNPGNAVKLLRLFNRRLNGGMNRFVINPSIAVPLVDLSNDAIDKLLQYNLGAPKPGA
jgi:hypothetical protein